MHYDKLDMDVDFVEVWLKHSPVKTWEHFWGEWKGVDEYGFAHLAQVDVVTSDHSHVCRDDMVVRLDDISMILGTIDENTRVDPQSNE